ncbi:hypothetical protein J4407_00610 [Candidatus Pacearchaeota archaeon]|nr:hypothetical protein [Candidatus Pacearchaeota archaeon]
MVKRQNWVVIILILLVIGLSFFVLYDYVIKPSISGYTIGFYNQGAVDMANEIVKRAQEQGFVQINVNEGESVILIPYDPNQAGNTVTPTEESSG